MKKKATAPSKKLSDVILNAIKDKKGLDIQRLNLKKVKGAITDAFVICTGTSDRHVQALADNVQAKVMEEMNEKPLSVEGYQLGEWVLIDFVDVVVHIFQRETRGFYNIEELWGDAETEKVK